jgi:hypothetical protein
VQRLANNCGGMHMLETMSDSCAGIVCFGV